MEKREVGKKKSRFCVKQVTTDKSNVLQKKVTEFLDKVNGADKIALIYTQQFPVVPQEIML